MLRVITCRNRKGQFCKGQPPWNKGLIGVQHHTTQSKRKLSLAFSGEKHPMYGKTHTLEARNKIRLNNILKGNKPPSRFGTKHTVETRLKMSKQRRKEQHWNWQGGHSCKYPLGWTKTFKEQIRYRDNYKCQLCSVHEIECLSTLCIHHIDYDKKNLEHTNLISLCRSCHMKTNSKKQYWIKYFGVRHDQ